MSLNFINQCLQGSLVKCGNRQRALNIYSGILGHIRMHTNENPLLLIQRVLEKFRPSVSLWTKKVGGTSYKIPYLITKQKGYSLVLHILLKEAALRPERSIITRIGNLFLESAKGRHVSIEKRKLEIHKTALHNRAFLRLRRRK